MADTTARTLQILELLQSAQLRTVSELADRLGVGDRTIRRDVARLDDLGVPVETIRGRYGGYRLAAGQRVLPIMFSSEEVVTVFLGLSQAQASAQEPEVVAQPALSKIKRALPIADAKRIDALLSAMTTTIQARRNAPDPAVMLTLAEAVNHHQMLDLRYLNSAGITSRRMIHPYGLVAHLNQWYLLALDAEKDEERTFRVDRIRTTRATSTTFTAPEHLDVKARLLDRFAEADYRWHVVLHIHAAEDHIRARLPASVARLVRMNPRGELESEDDPPMYRAQLHVENLDWLPPAIAALGCKVEIERPEELRDRVKEVAKRMLHAPGAD